MNDGPPSLFRRIVANGCFLAGLWLAGSAAFDLVGLDPDGVEAYIGPATSLGAGVLFLGAAWRLRDAMRWRGGDDG